MPAKRDDWTIPVALTQTQRRELAALVPALEGLLEPDEMNRRVVRLVATDFAQAKSATEMALSRATGTTRSVLQKLVSALGAAGAGTGEPRPKGKRKAAPSADECVFQFKITLADIEPPIWRRIQVRDETLDALHQDIQNAMGWESCHLHEFTVRGQKYGDPSMLDGGWEDTEVMDSASVRLGELLARARRGTRFQYLYDFGDSWWHEIQFEGLVPAEPGVQFPRCIEGARACPFEDIGGVWGYEELLRAHAGEESDEFENFEFEDFDPEFFDPREATEAMRPRLSVRSKRRV